MTDKLVLARISVAYEVARSRVQILFRWPNAFPKRRWWRLVEDADTAAWPLGDLDPVQTGGLVVPAWSYREDLAGWQWIAADAAFALKLRRRNEVLDPVEPHAVAAAPDFWTAG